MAWLLIIMVLVTLLLMYLYGGERIKSNTPPLSQKYPVLTGIIMDAHPRNRIIVDHGNKLVIGVTSSGGSTLFSFNETPDNHLRIVYSIKQNPMIPDFDLKFEFTQVSCLHDADSVWRKINQKIGDKIQGELGKLV